MQQGLGRTELRLASGCKDPVVKSKLEPGMCFSELRLLITIFCEGGEGSCDRALKDEDFGNGKGST